MRCMREVAEEDRKTGIIRVYIECGKGVRDEEQGEMSW